MRQTRDLARVGWRGLAARKGGVRSRFPYSTPLLPIGPHERPRLADSFLAPGSAARLVFGPTGYRDRSTQIRFRDHYMDDRVHRAPALDLHTSRNPCLDECS